MVAWVRQQVDPQLAPGLSKSRRRRSGRRQSRLSDDTAASYAFLISHGLAPATMIRALKVARRWQCSPHTVLIALGWMTAEAYAGALSDHLEIEWRVQSLEVAGEVAIDALALRPDEVAALVVELRSGGHYPVLSLPMVENRGVRPAPSPEDVVQEAGAGLKRRRPAESAASAMWLWQRLAVTVTLGLLAGGAVIAPGETVAVLLGLLAFPFVLVTSLRLLSVFHLTFSGWRGAHFQAVPERLPDDLLPIYTVLVPLYDEAEVVGDLVGALMALDYPPDRLDILLLVEASDSTTRVRLNAERLPPSFRVIVIPPGDPQTKPRALNYGLQHARGAFVVVYDAEDAPEPDQLRRAIAVLVERPEDIGCVQARLNIYNTNESWLTRGIMAQTPQAITTLHPNLYRMGVALNAAQGDDSWNCSSALRA